MGLLPIFYLTDIDSPSGYSNAARMHIRALMEVGVTVWVEQHKHDTTDFIPNDYWKAKLPLLLNPMRPTRPGIKIWHETPEFYNPDPEHYNIGMVAWETNRIPSYDLGGNPRNNWVKQLNRQDEIWTFCSSAKEAFERSGVFKPIYVFPHPADLDTYVPKKRTHLKDEYGHDLPDSVCVFLSVFQWCHDEDTRVLTRDGFKYFRHLSYEDEVATLNLETEELEYQLPTEIVAFRRDEPLMHIESQHEALDLMITPEHNLVVRDNSDGKLKLMPAKELLAHEQSYDGSQYLSWPPKSNEQLLDFVNGFNVLYREMGISKPPVEYQQNQEHDLTHTNVSCKDYHGFVYCATVPNSTMLVERNGKVCWSGNSKRKNPLDLLLGYWTAFDGHKDVMLYIKTYGSSFQDTANISKLTKQFKRDLRLKAPPRVQLLFSHIPEVELPDLYSSCDIYVTTSLGEGFGLPNRDAMACGKPTVFPDASAYLDYADATTGYPVETDEEPVYGMIHIPWYEGNQRWWKVRYPSLVKAFQQSYKDWKAGKLKEKGVRARKRVEQLHSFERVGNMMKKRLEAISSARQSEP